MSKKLILYIAMSEDGFIAGPGDDLGFLEDFQTAGEDYGYSSFIDSVDTVIVGRKTYDKVKDMGYPYHEDKEVYVICRSPKETLAASLHFYSGAVPELIHRLKTTAKKDLYCDGGAVLALHLFQLNVIVKIILSIIPTQLQKGTLLFKDGKVPINFKLLHALKYDNGLIQQHWERESDLPPTNA